MRVLLFDFFSRLPPSPNPRCNSHLLFMYIPQIDTRATSHQVPSIILFEDGVEVERRPKLFEGGTVEKCRMNQQFIEEQFMLQKRLSRTGKQRAEKKTN